MITPLRNIIHTFLSYYKPDANKARAKRATQAQNAKRRTRSVSDASNAPNFDVSITRHFFLHIAHING